MSSRVAVAVASVALVGRFVVDDAVDPAFGQAWPTSGSEVHYIDLQGGYTELSIDGAADDNDVRVSYDAATRRYTITDTTGVVGCLTVAPHTVSCYGAEPLDSLGYSSLAGRDRVFFDASIPHTYITVQSGDHGDRIELERGIASRARLYGRRDPDTLIGATAGDFLPGEGGDDRLFGREGEDHLNGGGGKDTLIAGPGDDTINAADGRRDPVISCGPGEDDVRFDRRDPKPQGCEQVRTHD